MTSEDRVVSHPSSSVPTPYTESGVSTHVSLGRTVIDAVTVVAQVATSPKDALFSGIRLLRAAAAGRFSQQLNTEWSTLAEKGKIKGDYGQTDQARTILADTLESFDQAAYDAEQIDLLRRLFLAAA
jgi:hypothetical protein